MTALTENDFSKEVVKFFSGKLAQSGLDRTIAVAEKIKILKDFTIGKDTNGHWRLIIGFQEQDIVFYTPIHSIRMSDFQSNIMTISRGSDPIIIPLLICELKVGKGTNTHAVIVYSSIATQLKNIFPHCAYYFVMKSNKWRRMQPETILRHSKGFDRVFLNWEDEMEVVWEDVQSHFNYLSQLGVIDLSHDKKDDRR